MDDEPVVVDGQEFTPDEVEALRVLILGLGQVSPMLLAEAIASVQLAHDPDGQTIDVGPVEVRDEEG